MRVGCSGLELSGAAIKQDKDSTRDFYGRMVPFRTSLQGTVDVRPGLSISSNTVEVGKGCS